MQNRRQWFHRLYPMTAMFLSLDTPVELIRKKKYMVFIDPRKTDGVRIPDNIDAEVTNVYPAPGESLSDCIQLFEVNDCSSE